MRSLLSKEAVYRRKVYYAILCSQGQSELMENLLSSTCLSANNSDVFKVTATRDTCIHNLRNAGISPKDFQCVARAKKSAFLFIALSLGGVV